MRCERHSVTGSIAKKSSRGVLDVPVYIVAMEKSENDARRAAELLERLVRFHGSRAVRELVRAEVGDGALPPMQVQGLRVLRETHTAAASSRSAAAAAEAARAPRRRGDAEWCHVRAAAGWRRERARLRLLLQAEIR